MPAYVVEARQVSKNFGGVPALAGADFSCPPGSIVGLLGENGSGKTTLSRILTGYYRPSSGTVRYRGEVVSFRTPAEAARLGIGMVHQNFSLVPDMSVKENIWLGCEPLGRAGFVNDRRIGRELRTYLDRLCPWIRPEAKVSSLSPSELQLVEIVKALSRNPIFLILDEPTSALERQQVDAVFTLLRDLRRSGRSMVFISHRLHEVEQICDSIVVLRNGKTAGTVDLSGGGPVDYDRIVNLITGNREIAKEVRRFAEEERAPLLEVQGLGDGLRLFDVSLRVREGEIVGIAGLQGQGQEELLMALAGFRRTVAGRVALKGQALALHSPRRAIEAGMVVVPGNRQTEGLFMDRPVFYNATFPALVHRRGPFPSSRFERETSSRLVADFAIKASSLGTPVTALSGGNAQKLVVSKWLPLGPKVLLMSDPAKGIDVQAKAELYRIVLELAEKGTGILLFASDLHELITHCDRILVLYEGRVVDEVPGGAVDEEGLLSRCLRREPSA